MFIVPPLGMNPVHSYIPTVIMVVMYTRGYHVQLRFAIASGHKYHIILYPLAYICVFTRFQFRSQQFRVQTGVCAKKKQIQPGFKDVLPPLGERDSV